MTPKITAGDRLRREFDKALEAASEAAGGPLQWTEHEAEALRVAADAEDRRAVLRRQFAALADADEPQPGLTTKVSAELRSLEKQVLDVLARVSIGEDDGGATHAARVSQARREANRQRTTFGGGRRGTA